MLITDKLHAQFLKVFGSSSEAKPVNKEFVKINPEEMKEGVENFKKLESECKKAGIKL